MANGPTFFPPLGAPKMAGSVDPTGWDRCVIAGQVVPGLTSVTRGGIRLKEDPKSKSGSDGTHPTYHGLDPQPLELEIVTFCDEDREALASLVRTVAPQPGKQPRPVSFDHPSVRHLGISTLTIVGVGALMPVADRPGVAKMNMEARQWAPPKTPKKSATATPTRAVRNVRSEAKPQNYVEKNPPPTAQPDLWAPPTFG